MYFLNLIRFKNLIILAIVQVIIKYGLFEPIGAQVALSNIQFSFLILATLSIAAAGNIINDIYDVEIDRINKPKKLLIGKKISKNKAYNLFIILNLLGVAAGFYLANSINKPGFASIFIVVSALLYLYASYIKGILIVGNLVISLLVALSLLIVGIFDLIPLTNSNNLDIQLRAMRILLHYASFAFLINFTREIIKDIEDINGDRNGGLNSLPIAIGRKRSTIVVFGLGVFLILSVIIYMYSFLYRSQIMVLYFLFLVLAPLFYYSIKAWSAETQKDYAYLSSLLKIIMIMGTCSILLYKDVFL